MDIRLFVTLDSTNKYCKLLNTDSVEEFTVVWAGNQTAGLGQQGNVWVSEPYKNLTFSLILKPTFLSLSDQWLLSMTLALSVSDCLIEILPNHNIAIKWPNDIYIGNRKVCGILVTNQITNGIISQAICGIGLNINQTRFPDWVPNPTSLAIESGNTYNIKNVLDHLLQSVESRYRQLKNDPYSIKPDYLKRLFRLGIPSPYILQDKRITATITDVDRHGHLLLTTLDGEALNCDIKGIQFVI